MSMITTSAWVRRGVAAQFPTKYEINEEEMNRISKLARMQLEDAKGELKAAQDADEDMQEDEDAKETGAMEDDSKKTESEKKPYFSLPLFCAFDDRPMHVLTYLVATAKTRMTT